MRKTIAIFFLIIHVYNLVGYKALFAWLEQKASTSLVSKLDKGQYLDEELVEIKVPYVQLYQPGPTAYERHDGEIEINGQHYNYVKRKITNDTIYLLCVPNKINNNLASAKNAFYNDAPDHTNGKSKTGTLGLKCFSYDCNFIISNYELSCPDTIFKKDFILTHESLDQHSISPAERPPCIYA